MDKKWEPWMSNQSVNYGTKQDINEAILNDGPVKLSLSLPNI